MLKLYKFGKQWGIADASPFCVKLESFLRLNNIPFELGAFDIKSTLKKAPKKKMPFIITEDGKKLGDSTLIIEYLSQKHNIDMDDALSPEQSAQSRLIRRALDEALYFNLVYSRWIDDYSWNIIKPIFFGNMGLPNFLVNIIAKKVRSDLEKKIVSQGTGRHTQEEIYNTANKDLSALATLLGDNTWFFGAKNPTLLDIWVHSFVINIIVPPIDNAVKKHTLTLNNLCEHAHRMEKLAYTDDQNAK